MKNPLNEKHRLPHQRTMIEMKNEDGEKSIESNSNNNKKHKSNLLVYRSKTNVSCIQLLLYNVSNNVQRLKDFHHFFSAFHSLLSFRCCFFFVFFRACLFVVRLPLLLSWVVGAIFPAAWNQQQTAATVNPSRVHQWQRHIIIVKLRINSFKHCKMKLIFFLFSCCAHVFFLPCAAL